MLCILFGGSFGEDARSSRNNPLPSEKQKRVTTAQTVFSLTGTPVVGSCYVWGSRGEGVRYGTQGLTPPQPPKVTRRAFRGTRKGRVRLTRSLEKASSRPDLARRSTGASPDTVWTGVGVVLDSAGDHLRPFPALRGTIYTQVLVWFAGFRSVPPL